MEESTGLRIPKVDDGAMIPPLAKALPGVQPEAPLESFALRRMAFVTVLN
tara:strand:- start:821 stop:970 length:150 start_codon:yes stop_codon:yes gene_type:complete